MSGRRRKALRQAFKKEHLRPPADAKFLGWRERGNEAVWQRDEMRPIKKAYVRGLR